MATKNPTYDLTLLLDTSTDEERRKKILSDTEGTIRQSGEVVGVHDWGVRPTAFEMDKRTDAEYHLIQFHGDPELLESLDHTLRITDGIQRFRIIKLHPGVGAPPDLRNTPATAPTGGDEMRDDDDRGDRSDRNDRR
jgi:small subunit ribosomal protein S6